MSQTPDPSLQELAAAACSRREFLTLGSTLALAQVSGVSGCAALLTTPTLASNSHLAFTGVPVATGHAVVIAPGYQAMPLFLWGDPVSDGPPFRANGANSAAEQAEQAGQMHDGMEFFSLPLGSNRADHGLLVMNHEYFRQRDLFPDGADRPSLEKVRKAQAAVGVSVIEVRRGTRGWEVIRPSRWARRITALTPMRIGGPAAGSSLMRTAADATGMKTLGTLANCAGGLTPWGTYLTCEENFHDFFGTAEPAGTLDANARRYQLPRSGSQSFHAFDKRFDWGAEPNAPNTFGWVVEVDPYDPTSVPVKRTALGRMRHESAYYALARDRRVVIYMGDDARFEYIYKFVSAKPYDPQNRMANANLLDDGTLYVARFHEGGRGEWIALRYGENGLDAAAGFADQAHVVTFARRAGDRVGATKTDRPEWIVVQPHTGEVYASATGNRDRGKPGMEGGNTLHPANNLYGSIIRWREDGQDAAATSFAWDVFIQAGSAQAERPEQRGTVKGDAFTNPDGLMFDPAGRLWICTDSAEADERELLAMRGNDAVLAADIRTGQTKRFLVGPDGCETTGLCFTPDGRTAFVNIQHPAQWPNVAVDGKPRSGTLVITKDDGGIIGS
jgi:uncharacterized protein